MLRFFLEGDRVRPAFGILPYASGREKPTMVTLVWLHLVRMNFQYHVSREVNCISIFVFLNSSFFQNGLLSFVGVVVVGGRG